MSDFTPRLLRMVGRARAYGARPLQIQVTPAIARKMRDELQDQLRFPVIARVRELAGISFVETPLPTAVGARILCSAPIGTVEMSAF